mmetsp:Transcript_20420/g.57526  ORF Transcript_20420/g.57526 Transcript_20420/m.57526 type:complete len:361 (-) Transcript_20420:2269-3351(-)
MPTRPESNSTKTTCPASGRRRTCFTVTVTRRPGRSESLTSPTSIQNSSSWVGSLHGCRSSPYGARISMAMSSRVLSFQPASSAFCRCSAYTSSISFSTVSGCFIACSSWRASEASCASVSLAAVEAISMAYLYASGWTRVLSSGSASSLSSANRLWEILRAPAALMKTCLPMLSSASSVRREEMTPSGRLRTPLRSGPTFRGPKPPTNCSVEARQGCWAAAFRSTPTWFTAVTSTREIVSTRASSGRQLSSSSRGKVRQPRGLLHTAANTGRGSSIERPRATARRTDAGWSPSSSIPTSEASQRRATVSSQFTTCKSRKPSEVVSRAWWCTMWYHTSRTSIFSLSCSRLPPPRKHTLGSH